MLYLIKLRKHFTRGIIPQYKDYRDQFTYDIGLVLESFSQCICMLLYHGILTIVEAKLAGVWSGHYNRLDNSHITVTFWDLEAFPCFASSIGH